MIYRISTIFCAHGYSCLCQPHPEASLRGNHNIFFQVEHPGYPWLRKPPFAQSNWCVTLASLVPSCGGLGKSLCLPSYFLLHGEDNTYFCRVIVGLGVISAKCLAGAGCLRANNSDSNDADNTYYCVISGRHTQVFVSATGSPFPYEKGSDMRRREVPHGGPHI